jgi:hypothetical protein
MDLIALITILSVILGVFVVVYYHNFGLENRKWRSFFHQLAESTGLEIQQNEESFYPNLSGHYFGHPTKLEIQIVDGCEGVLPGICARITLCLGIQSDASLDLERKSIFSRDQIKIGDSHFEEEYVISSQSEGFARRLLASTRLREKLIEARFNKLTIKGEKLCGYILGIDKRFDELSFCLSVLNNLANLIERD